MFNRVSFEFFRCFQNASAPLKPLTVLIGPNDTGKSAFFQGILKATRNEPPTLSDLWRHKTGNEMKVTLWEPPLGVKWKGELIDQKLFEKGLPPTIFFGSPGSSTAFFQLNSTGISFTSKGHDDKKGLVQLNRQGDNIPTLLDYFLRKDRKRFDQIVAQMRDLVPGLADIHISTPGEAGTARRIDLIIENSIQVEESQISAGVKLILFFVALAHHPRPPGLILIEEPENGIHPRRLKDVMELLRKVTLGGFGGKPAQIILSTHSPYLLDFIDPATDQVLIFQRQADGNCLPQEINQDKLQDFLGGFMLGEIWFNEGEKGLVKGTA